MQICVVSTIFPEISQDFVIFQSSSEPLYFVSQLWLPFRVSHTSDECEDCERLSRPLPPIPLAASLLAFVVLPLCGDPKREPAHSQCFAIESFC